MAKQDTKKRLVNLLMQADLVAAIDAYARHHDLDRSKVIRLAIREKLQSKKNQGDGGR